MSKSGSLTKAEEQVMQVLWKTGGGFLKELVVASPEPHPHANTLATLLKILIEKGFAEFETHGRNNFYRARIGRLEYGKKSANRLIKSYFEGSPAKLVSQFISDQKLSEADLDMLLQKIQEAKKKNP